MALDSATSKIGFIGTGIMGSHMAGHIRKAGFELHVYNRTRARAEPLIAQGAIWHDKPGQLASVCDMVITIVGYPRDVEDVYLRPDGIVANARPGTLLVDMTTSSPELAERIARAAIARGAQALDAPVSGGDVGARDAKLSIMVGGAADAFAQAMPVLSLMGTNIVLQGGPGAGQHTKMCNQIIIASTVMGVAEGLSYARAAGLDPDTVIKCIGSGAAGSFQLNVLGPKMVKGDFAPGFFMEHMIKDLDIATAEAQRAGLDLSGLGAARQRYLALAASGHGREGTQAIIRSYETKKP